MPLDVRPYVDPASTAVVAMECQERLLGPGSLLPGLAGAAAAAGLVDNLAALFRSARACGVRIYHCTDERRADGLGAIRTNLTHLRMAGGPPSPGGMGPLLAPLAPQPADVVFPREQGVTGFFATGLDPYLRNTGVTTVVLTGVSLNLAVVGTAIEALNLGYTVVVPSDCVASDPPEYADWVMRYTLRNVGFVVPSAAITEVWNT